MVDCPCGYGKNLGEDKKNCPICGTDLTPLHRLKALPKFYYNEGIKLAEQGELDKAIERLMTSAVLDSDWLEPYLALGHIYTQKSLYEEAIIQYKKALKIEPENEKIKQAKEKAEEKINQLKNDRLKQANKISLFKKIVIGIPVGALLLGLVVSFLLQNFIKQKQLPLPILAEEIKQKIANYPELADSKIEVVLTKDGIRITGRVPTSLHKSLIAEITQNIAGNNPVDIQQLSIVPNFYTVKPGDNLSQIAYRYYGNSELWTKIFLVNKNIITDPNKIFVGQVLLIPNE